MLYNIHKQTRYYLRLRDFNKITTIIFFFLTKNEEIFIEFLFILSYLFEFNINKI